MPTDSSAPPSDLDGNGRKLYFKLRAFLRERGHWEDSDRYALGQTCRYEQRARCARGALVATGGDLLSEGYKGQPTEHPFVKIAVTNERLFMEGLKELGLTPRARAQLGLEAKPTGGKFGSLG